jgi:hypothetical protein
MPPRLWAAIRRSQLFIPFTLDILPSHFYPHLTYLGKILLAYADFLPQRRHSSHFLKLTPIKKTPLVFRRKKSRQTNLPTKKIR